MELGGEWLIWKHNHPMARNKGGRGWGGGGWERPIRSARSILAALLKQHGESLNDELLRMLLQIRSARSILAALLKQYDESLNDESLRTLLVDIEGIMNFYYLW